MHSSSVQPGARALIRRLVLLAALLALGACATGPKPEVAYVQSPAPAAVPGTPDAVSVVFSHYPSVIMTQADKVRIQDVLQKNINAAKRGPGDGAPRHFRVNVVMTEYDRGDMFDRMRGQASGNMHVKATVTVLLLPGNQKLSEFTVSEKYDGAGLTGYTTSIQHLEKGFLAAITNGVTKPK